MTPTGAETTGPRRTRWWLLALIAVVVLVPAAVTTYLVNREPVEPLYLPFAIAADGTPIDLGTLGGEWGQATDINTDGAVVGSTAAADGLAHAFLSRNGAMTDLGTARYAKAINDAGQVLIANWDPSPSGWQPSLWTDGAEQALTSDLGPLYQANDLDERGRVVGEMVAAPRVYTWPIKDTDGPTGPIGVLLEDGRATLLETADAMFTRTASINEAGTVLGQGRVKGSWPNHTLLWQAGTITDLGEGGTDGMNDRGQIVLQKQEGDSGSRFLYYLWEAGRLTPLDGADGTNVRANDINESGVVVGQVDDRAAVWRDGRITRLNLHSKNSVASAINDAGTIVGARQK
jgi:probable HAF family extracellular repeat protein